MQSVGLTVSTVAAVGVKMDRTSTDARESFIIDGLIR